MRVRQERIHVPHPTTSLIPPRFGNQICDREGKAEADSENDLQDSLDAMRSQR